MPSNSKPFMQLSLFTESKTQSLQLVFSLPMSLPSQCLAGTEVCQDFPRTPLCRHLDSEATTKLQMQPVCLAQLAKAWLAEFPRASLHILGS